MINDFISVIKLHGKKAEGLFNTLPKEEARVLQGVWALGFNPFPIILKNDKTKGTEPANPPFTLT
jgi:hypothetical protein